MERIKAWLYAISEWARGDHSKGIAEAECFRDHADRWRKVDLLPITSTCSGRFNFGHLSFDFLNERSG